jgi:predicted dehydrogenase
LNASESRAQLAVIGLGHWGPNRVRAVSEIGEAELRYVCDIDRDRLRRVAGRYPGAHPARDIDAVLDDPEVDGVVLATPVSTHYELSMRALDAGKHVLVEKPVAGSLAEAKGLFERAAEVDRVLMGGHTFLYSPPVRAVKEAIDAGKLGRLYFISSSRVNLGLHQRDASVLWDLAPHDFSILLHWLEAKPTTVSATGRDSIIPGTPDVAFVNLVFDDGLVANLELSWLAPSKLRRTVIVGSDRMIVYEDGAPEPVRIFDSGVVYKDPETFGEYHLSYRTGDIVSPHVDATEPIVTELRDFAAAILEGTEPRSSPEIAINTIEMIEAAEKSFASGGVRVSLDPVAVSSQLR